MPTFYFGRFPAFCIGLAAMILIPILSYAGEAPGTEDFDNLDAVQCFDDKGIDPELQICQYHGTDFVGKMAFKPGAQFTSMVFPEGFSYDESIDNWESVILGTDLGVNVGIDGQDVYFFGDTQPVWADKLTGSGSEYGLPFGFDFDGDQVLDAIHTTKVEDVVHYNSVTELVALHDEAAVGQFLNQAEYNTMFPGDLVSGTEIPFFVPTGAGQTDDKTLYLWYGKYINNVYCDQSHLLSMDWATGRWQHIAPFATKKFIQVNPILVSESELAPTGDACDIPFTEKGERGFLIYGSGVDADNTRSFSTSIPGGYCAQGQNPNYRTSGVYLAYVRLEDMNENVAENIWYWAGEDNGCWIQGDVDSAVEVFKESHVGEFSVQRIPDTQIAIIAHTHRSLFHEIISRLKPKLKNLNPGYLQVRAVDLARPWYFSKPKSTNSYGYGNYIIQSSMQVVPELEFTDGKLADNMLFFKRVISTWKGDDMDYEEEYGTSVIWSLLDLDDYLDELGLTLDEVEEPDDDDKGDDDDATADDDDDTVDDNDEQDAETGGDDDDDDDGGCGC